MLRFASVTVNLGPTFLSGALAANAGAVMDEPSCPLVQVTGGRLGFLNFDIHTSRKQQGLPIQGDIFIYNATMMPQGPYRHYVLNVIWIFINSLSILLTIYHLHRLYKDYTR